MKVQCDGCERAEAVIVCCADEAALCKECDIQVHEANKLASKHQRVPLFRPTSSTHCDICQEKTAYFFCLEDRALLCHSCDMSIHRSNASTSHHKRFLITGVTASLHTVSGQTTSAAAAAAASPGTPPPFRKASSKGPGPSRGKKQLKQQQQQESVFNSVSCEEGSPHLSATLTTPLASSTYASVGIREAAYTKSSVEVEAEAEVEAVKETSIFEFLTEAVPGWKCDELLTMAEGMDHGLSFSSKTDQTSFCLPFNDQLYSRSVPQMNSPLPTLTVDGTVVNSRTKQQQDILPRPEPDDSFIVPDLGLHSVPVPHPPPAIKRRKTYYSELDNIFL